MSATNGYLIDMDGVVYRGSQAIPGAAEFIRYPQDESISRPSRFSLTGPCWWGNLREMEIQLTPEREAQLAALARQQGRDVADVADEALAAYLDHTGWLAQAVEEGRAAARCGELLDHEQVGGILEQRYRPA